MNRREEPKLLSRMCANPFPVRRPTESCALANQDARPLQVLRQSIQGEAENYRTTDHSEHLESLSAMPHLGNLLFKSSSQADRNFLYGSSRCLHLPLRGVELLDDCGHVFRQFLERPVGKPLPCGLI